MSWTTPRTWIASEVVTAAVMNLHIKDNLNVLKTARDDSGRITNISSTTLADLSGANLTGVARAAAANAFSGRTVLGGTSTIRVPVGVDKYEDLGGGLRRGIWVEGDYLHHIAQNQTTEWRFLGEVVSTPAGALSGSLWVEGSVYVHYIDATGVERRCETRGVAAGIAHSDSGAIAGSVWIEDYVHWIREGGAVERVGHADVAHVDGTAHTDTHGDTAHVDTHTDSGHADSHGDTHEDTHSDTHSDAHEDFTHNDGPFHEHEDTHGDSHTDTHDDTHSDSHTDTAHGDAHTDAAHSDAAHVDHSDHGDAGHADQPTVVP